jgi:DNA-binding GntR family transcriptional regulator
LTLCTIFWPTMLAAEAPLSDAADVAADRGDTLAERSYWRLHRALMSGDLLPEQVLTVRGIADHYGVSLTPVREAIQRLVAERALTIENARTIRVPRLDVETYREILKIRLELEPMAAREAAVHMDNAEMDRLEQVVEAHHAAIVAVEAHQTLAANTDFHISIYRASNQPILAGIIESLWLRVGPTLNLLFPTYCGSLTGVDMHHLAMDALRRRDGDALARAVRDDLTHGAKFLVRLLKP